MSVINIPHDWKPRPYQEPLWHYLENGGKRAVAVWHRRAGKDLLSINWTLSSMMQRRGLYWHLFPTYQQGRKIVWDGFTRDGRGFLDHFPPELVANKNNTAMRVELKTGSIYQVVGTDNCDSLVGANPVGVVFSEYSLQDPKAWDLIRPILAENDGWALFIYTARGRNHGYDLLNMAKGNAKWFCEVLPVDKTNAIPLSVVEDERKSGMPEELIQQEYFCSFDAPLVGAYYGDGMARALQDKRITNVPWEPKLRVHTAWDLGVGDSTAIWFFQVYQHEIRIIDFYENNGEGLPHYIKVLSQKDYIYDRHYAPHDIEVRELTSGKARIDVARSLGIRFTVVKQHCVEDGIESVRNLLPRCWFNYDRCERGVEALRQYRKDFDEKKRVFRDKPMHDWSSHAADAFRYLAWGLRNKPLHESPRQQKAVNDYNVFD
jgi:hypothetical protein